MTPEELASRHPKLYHVTRPGAWEAISTFGLMPASALLERFEEDQQRRIDLATRRRPAEVELAHPAHGTMILNDNLPLSERALAACLDDGLTPQDWLRMLNERVFFWVDESRVARLLGARMNRARSREVLVFDTLGLVSAHAARVEISPINSGSTLRKPARRGLATFTPVLAKSYREWRRQRGGNDRIVEVTVRGGVADIKRYRWTATP
jgi:uncharacterized protein DUF7002